MACYEVCYILVCGIIAVFVASLLWANLRDTTQLHGNSFLSKYVRVNNGRPTWPHICAYIYPVRKGLFVFFTIEPLFIAFAPSNDSSRVFLPSFTVGCCALCMAVECLGATLTVECLGATLQQLYVCVPSFETVLSSGSILTYD